MTSEIFNLVSAILRGGWLLHDEWARQHLPIVRQLLEGKDVTGLFFSPKVSDNENAAVMLSAGAYRVSVYSELESLPLGSVAVVNLVGPIIKYAGPCSGPGSSQITALLDRLDQSDNITGVVLNTDTPGGMASGTAALSSRIAGMSKPIIGFVDDGMAASAGMWGISGCREIYASNGLSSFGSIGAYCMLVEDSGKKGQKVHEIYAPQSTDKNKVVRDAFAGDYSGIEEELRVLVEAFKDQVQTNRKGKVKAEAFTGKMYRAQDAIKVGLADGIMSFSQVVDRVQQLAKKKTVSKPPNNNMAKNQKKYPALAAAAGWGEDYEAAEDGLHLDAAAADQVETALAAGANAATALAAANTKTGEDATTITGLQTQLSTAQADATSWKEKAEAYGHKSSNSGTAPVTGEDTPVDTSADPKAVHPFTAEAMSLMSRRRKRTEV